MINNRECVILCNFNDKEFKTIRLYASMIGIKDLIRVSYKNGDSIINDILNNKIKEDGAQSSIKDRAIVFNSLEPRKVNVFIDNMKKMRLAPSMKAIVTKTSIEWTLDMLLHHLKEERIWEEQGKIQSHEKEKEEK